MNIGNDMQSLAIEQLYLRLGIEEGDIVRVGYHELRTYDSHYVILPMNMFGSKDEIFPLSPYIIPLYIGFNYVSGKIAANHPHLKPYEPIGCRDEYTLRVMRGAGIEAYLSGCLTLTLPRRRPPANARRVFLVDVPEGLETHIPEALMGDVEYLAHEVELDQQFSGRDVFKATREYARFILNRYAEEAALVVTSRLHCAAPCMALGIPVILVKDNVDINLSWLDKFAKIHTRETFADINWQPQSLDLEALKEQMFGIFAEQLQALVRSREALYELSSFFEERERAPYNNRLAGQLAVGMASLQRKSLRYAIWGAGAGGTLAHLLIQETYPDYRMVAIVDGFETGGFFGLDIRHPDSLAELDYDFLFICTYSGREEARRKLLELGREEGKDYMFLVSHVVNTRHGASEDFKSQLARFIGQRQ
ncbi:polysaccharide pyruvyl transferase family protein [Pseudomonas sp. YY-1]|uniref:polysaccharide pyruvyl transferase family protein n=1 Tax=Pseudomonas sp. YY-1 TaxID=2058659 RepID=UPI0012FF058A|nr:polysaccharide pyruvyl transferase family protein [Pseudomonas sp. YY-1]